MGIIVSLLFVTATGAPPTYFSVDKVFKKNSNQIQASIKITPKKGWKWNEDYPSKFWIGWSSKFKLRQTHKEMVYSERDTQVIFGLGGEVRPVTKVIIDGTFSLCNKAVCKVWRFKTFEVGEKNET
tara:strand:+ start:507 stop:884 length:378 start_codon:yes stop_codon:yes gene_type:complete